MRIGVAGLGKMGSAMAARLAEAGEEVVVWNRTRERAEATGLDVADCPCELAEQVETVITSLFDDAAVESVYRGPHGLHEKASGKLFVEMSTIRPGTQERMAQAVRAAGGAYVECPVGGTTGPARSGKLLGLMGGEEADVTRARPVLDLLCRRVEHVGPVGAGASAKLAINLPLAVFWQAFGEAVGLIKHLNIDPEHLVELFADTSGGANVLKVRGPAIAKALAGGDPGGPTFDVDSIRKDLRTMIAEAESRGFELPVAARTLGAFDEAAQAGLGKKDCSLLPAFWAAKADRAH
jgi:3-hydroxyisobutyrate dehydrogenase